MNPPDFQKDGLIRASPVGAAARVRMQIFPLAADPEQLEDFCNRWFNTKIPAGLSLVRPALPVVFCTVLTYEDMGDDYRWHSGLLAQDEIYFLVIIERYQWIQGQLRFVEHGVTTPFIFVDSAESVALGRQHFGFPKEVCQFFAGDERQSVPWAPYGNDLLTVKTWQPTPFGRSMLPLLSLGRAPLGNAEGFDPGIVPVPLSRSQRANRSDVLWWLQTLWSELRIRSHPAVIASTAERLASLARVLYNGIVVSCYNLRQIPHPYFRDRVLYRDLINFRINLRGLQNFRLLNEVADPGNYTVSIKRRNITPIVERLGLRVARRSRFSDGLGDEVVDQIEAILPAAAQADMTLRGARRLAWQFEGRPWISIDAKEPPDQPVQEPPEFDDYLGASAALLLADDRQHQSRDFKFMMLAGRTSAVDRYIRAYVAADANLQVEPESTDGWTAIRLLWAQDRQRRSNEIEGVEWQMGRYLSISAPVTYVHKGERQRALLLLYEFTDNPFNIYVSRTMFSGPSHQAWFDGAAGDWFESTQDVTQVQVLSTTLLHRTTQETRFEISQWLDVISDSRPMSLARPNPAPALMASFASDVADIRPLLIFGGIADPSNPLQWVERRCARIEYRTEWLVPRSPPLTGERHWLRILRTPDYPLVSGLELVTDNDVTFSVPARRSFPFGRLDHVPVVALSEAAGSIQTRSIDILWSRRGLAPRTYRGLGLGLPKQRGDP